MKIEEAKEIIDNRIDLIDERKTATQKVIAKREFIRSGSTTAIMLAGLTLGVLNKDATPVFALGSLSFVPGILSSISRKNANLNEKVMLDECALEVLKRIKYELKYDINRFEYSSTEELNEIVNDLYNNYVKKISIR